MKLIMLKGLPGSGKSTWAKQMSCNNQQYIRVNKDDIRNMVGYTGSSRENLVLTVRDAAIAAGLKTYKHVIVDDTNFHPKHEKRLREIAIEYEAEFEIKEFNMSLKECIKNDLKRPISVGEKVIKKMYRQYLLPKIEKPPYNFNNPDAIICDLDGTLAIHQGRSPYDLDKLETDTLNVIVFDVIMNWVDAKKELIFVSGREDKYKEKTQKWLQQFLPESFLADKIFMRPTGDKREDSIVKQELYEKYIKENYNVLLVLDDRNRVVDMWRRNGLTCFQVAEGDF